ncbi:MAG: nitroreductase family protein [Candidatus Peribacteria bacterium]|jgi:nitroreductase|nr:nitroreductase family protein [Candidatus Peribacteria bacterium]
MNTLETIKTRRSIRAYTDQEIQKADLQEIITSGMYAPSAHNQQAREFLVIQNKDQQSRLGEHLKFGKMLPQANAIIVSCFDKNKLTDAPFIQQDMGACTQNILLSAQEKGIGAVRIGIYPVNNPDNFLNAYLGIPESFEVFNLISLGYPNISAPSRDKECDLPEKIHRIVW